jgi:hypothetical protein
MLPQRQPPMATFAVDMLPLLRRSEDDRKTRHERKNIFGCAFPPREKQAWQFVVYSRIKQLRISACSASSTGRVMPFQRKMG